MRDHFMRNLWRWKCGVREVELTTHFHTMEQARANWFPGFVELMRNRMMLGIFRYGDFRDPQQVDYDLLGSARQHIDEFERTGNGEHLVDAANLLGITFAKRTHPRFHFYAVDDGRHAEPVDG